MIQSFRGKNLKDTETPSETIVLNTVFNTPGKNFQNKGNTFAALSITDQQLIEETFDSVIEKRK